MYRLPVRGDAPEQLLNSAPGAVQAIVDAVNGGIVKLNFRSGVYASTEVRVALDGLQHGKCAFCEVHILPVSTPHVEHFRPKAAYIDEEDGSKQQPGYYWLAYSWSNLLLSCPRCNSTTFKGIRFPLQMEVSRALSPADDLSLEQPLLIDPYAEDPRDFIRFRGAVAYPVAGNAKGTQTISVLGLNREDLVDARSEHLRLFFTLANAAAGLSEGNDLDQVQLLLREFLSERGIFRSCLDDALNNAI